AAARAAPRRAPAPAPELEPTPPEPPVRAPDPAPHFVPTPPVVVMLTPDAGPPGWRELLARGDGAGAASAAETAGAYDDACATASSPELMLLGDAARAAGRSARAVQVYRAVRARFPGTDLSATAAFHLGQIA